MVRSTGKSIQGNENTTWLINQITHSDVQYPTLSKEEEQKLIERYKDDREELNKLLILHNIKIVFNIAKKYASKTDDFDNLIQDGMVGLAEAAKRFDVNAGIKFITYAHIWVKKYILSSFYAKNIDVDKNTTSLNSVVSSMSKDSDSVEFSDYINDYVDPSCFQQKDVVDEISANEQVDICGSLMKTLESDTSLSVIDKNVFQDIFYNREKTIDIADKYQMTKEDVLQIKHKILAKFKNILADEYDISTYDQVS